MYRHPNDPKEGDMVGAVIAGITHSGGFVLISVASDAAPAAQALRRTDGDQEHGHEFQAGSRPARR